MNDGQKPANNPVCSSPSSSSFFATPSQPVVRHSWSHPNQLYAGPGSPSAASSSSSSSSSSSTSLAAHKSPSDLSAALSYSPYQELSPFPKNAISGSDLPVVQLYFNRHPSDVVIEPQFIAEMNAYVLLGLQRNAEAVTDILYCIGHTYLDRTSSSSSAVETLTRRARSLARLRQMQSDSCQLEMTTLIILGLSAMEVCSFSYLSCNRH